MAKLTRVTQPIFASDAAVNETSVFGTMKTSAQYTANIADSIDTVSFTKGWSDAVELDYAPYMEDMNTVQRAVTYQIAYNQQEGIPEWASDTEYYKGSVVKLNTANGMQIYSSLVDNNVGNLVSDNTKWKLLIDSANNYATTNTAQTISGTKTFTSNIITKKGGTYDNYASETQSYMGIVAHDSTGLLMGIVDCWTGTDGTTETRIVSHNPNNSNIYSLISARVDTNGNVSTRAPTPASNSNDNNIATTAWVNTVGNNVVHLTGNELIGGAKILAKSKQYDIEGGQIAFEPPTDTSLTGNAFIDIYGNLMRFVGRNSSNNYTTPLYLDLETNVAIANASDATNSVVTTTGISKSGNGFVRLGNGIIIQWGRYPSYVNPDPQRVTFPTPFTSTNYKAVCTYFRTGGDVDSGKDHINVDTQFTTGFTFRMSDTAAYGVNWIAIGY